MWGFYILQIYILLLKSSYIFVLTCKGRKKLMHDNFLLDGKYTFV